MIHPLHRIDGHPPAHPGRLYLCQVCGPFGGADLDKLAVIEAAHGFHHVLVEFPWTTNPGVLTLWALYLVKD
jgi:hypothetical protein